MPNKPMSFHEQALMLLRRQLHDAEDKVRLWQVETARLRSELRKEEARNEPVHQSQPPTGEAQG
jgi:hypothetical protein